MFMGTSWEIALRWMSQNTIDGKSPFVQVIRNGLVPSDNQLLLEQMLTQSCCFWAFGLWLVEQFPPIYRETTDWIELKFGGSIAHYGTHQAWLIFG